MTADCSWYPIWIREWIHCEHYFSAHEAPFLPFNIMQCSISSRYSLFGTNIRARAQPIANLSNTAVTCLFIQSIHWYNLPCIAIRRTRAQHSRNVLIAQARVSYSNTFWFPIQNKSINDCDGSIITIIIVHYWRLAAVDQHVLCCLAGSRWWVHMEHSKYD